MLSKSNFLFVSLVAACLALSSGFGIVSPFSSSTTMRTVNNKASTSSKGIHTLLSMASDKNRDDGVIELVDTDDDETTASAGDDSEPSVVPFLSQGELDEDALKLDLSNPKQTRVIIYIILSLVPILFLIPLMLGDREFLPALIPMADMPPVEL